MKILPGDNTVRVAGYHKVPNGIYDCYQFEFINRAGYTHSINLGVPAGVVPPRIVRDLMELRKKNLWFVIYLKEKCGKLMIHTIKEPKVSQAELWDGAKNLVN